MRLESVVRTSAPQATILIRFAVGLVFASEGALKFLQAEAQGAGRFARIGLPIPGLLGPLVGGVEVVCGLLILAGLMTRLAALPLVVNMLVALASTKLPILLGHGYWIFAHTFAPKAGVGSFLHESRTDLSMLCGSLFLAWAGAGPWSLDARLSRGSQGMRGEA